MKKILIAASVLILVGLAVSAFAMTGPLVNGEPAYNEIAFSSFDTATFLHDETVNNPKNWYKGWWYVNLTNNTGKGWGFVTITPGVGNLVAIVQGNGLEDEWGFVGNSVVSNKAGNALYTGSLGSRTYDNGASGLLWSKAKYTFNTPVANGQKVAFKVYTDNSYYDGPYASSFSLTITPGFVPEPSSLVAMATGLLGLAGMIRRKRS